MEPTRNIERLPVQPTPAEQMPVQGVEQQGQAQVERAPMSVERSAAETQTSAPTMLPPVQDDQTVQHPPAPVQPLPMQDPVTAGAPKRAADVDVIEREWVNQTKKVINMTQNDPRAQEDAIEKMQAAYLKTRYGKEVKPPRAA